MREWKEESGVDKLMVGGHSIKVRKGGWDGNGKELSGRNRKGGTGGRSIRGVEGRCK